MRKLIKYLGLSVLIFLVWVGWCQFAFGATTYTCDTCENKAGQLDVQDKIDLAIAGDTVSIPAGDCTWDTALVITVNITLHGAGSDSAGTNITSDGVTPIDYDPTSPSATDTFELYGMSFDRNDTSVGTYVINADHTSTTVMQQINIHDLIVTNTYRFIFLRGLYKGVIHNNNVTTTYDLQQNVGPSDGGLAAWNAIEKCTGDPLSCTHDDGDNLYFEDNIISCGDGGMESGGAGFSWVFRYNDITTVRGAPFFEWHGGCSGADRCSSMDMAIYGNELTADNSGYLQDRGGMAMIFYNLGTDTRALYTLNMKNEYTELCGGYCQTTTNSQPQNISDTYAWVNIRSGSNYPGLLESGDAADEIAENSEYFVQRAGDFDGSGDSDKGGGCGCGTVGNIPATCTTGVGYWATDQSCSSIANYTGKDPTTPISGKLYKCTSTNNWTEYYTPYTYPHPLTGPRIHNLTTPESYSSGTTTGVLGFSTEVPSTCKFSTTNQAYADMAAMSTTGVKTHSQNVAVSDDNPYTRYCKCQDAENDEDSITITFTVLSGGGDPVLGGAVSGNLGKAPESGKMGTNAGEGKMF